MKRSKRILHIQESGFTLFDEKFHARFIVLVFQNLYLKATTKLNGLS